MVSLDMKLGYFKIHSKTVHALNVNLLKMMSKHLVCQFPKDLKNPPGPTLIEKRKDDWKEWEGAEKMKKRVSDIWEQS